jgi:hypothetical protein
MPLSARNAGLHRGEGVPVRDRLRDDGHGVRKGAPNETLVVDSGGGPHDAVAVSREVPLAATEPSVG